MMNKETKSQYESYITILEIIAAGGWILFFIELFS